MATAELRVLHISDLHFGRPAVPEQIDGIEELIRREKFDVVAISGDLSQRARAGEFQRAAVFLRETEKLSRTIVVPGNHDVAWWYAPLGLGKADRVYQNYKAWISPELEPTLSVPGATFVGVNTSHGVTRRTLTWNVRDISIIGDITQPQLARVRESFANAPAGDAKVVVMHHNPVKGELSQRHGLKNTRKILGAYADMGVDLVLCGHDHQEAIHYVEHTRKGTVISTAGTVSNRSRGGRPSSVNVIHVRPGQLEIVTHVWEHGTSGFREGPRRCFDR